MKDFFIKIRILSVLACLVSGVGVFAQPASTYTVQTSTAFTISAGQGSGTCNCVGTSGCTSTQYGFSTDGVTFYWDTYSSTGVSSSFTLKYYSRIFTRNYLGGAGQCAVSGSYSSPTFVKNISITVESDITFSPPSSICANGSTISLISYTNKTTGSLTPTFYVDGSAIVGSGFNPISYSVGNHTLAVAYPFKSGTSTKSGTIAELTTSITISSSPSSQSVCPYGTATFTAASSDPSISYNWQEYTGSTWGDLSNGMYYSGVTTGTLTMPTVQSSVSGRQYRLKATNGCATGYSSAATLTVYGQVGITSSPSNQTICQNGTASFSVGVNGGNFSYNYQWQFSNDGGSTWNNFADNATISGSTSSTLTWSNIGTAYNGFYVHCVAGDGCGTFNQNTSASALLTVNSNVSSTNPSSQTVCPGSNFTTSITASGTGGYSYQWYVVNSGGAAPASGWYASIPSGSNTAAISGQTSSALSAVTGYTNAGTVYAVVGGTCGYFVTATCTLGNYTDVGISSQPTASTTLCPGGMLNLSVTGSGTSPTYQWKKNGTAISGATSSTYSIASVSAADAATYTVQVSGACGSPVTSSNAVLNVSTNVGITTQPTATTTLCPGGTLNLSVVASGTSPTYQWLKNGSAIGGATGSTYSIASVSAADAATYTVQVSGACGSPVTSSNAVLNVNTNVGINTQPAATTTLCPGGAYTISVNPSGTAPYGYTWFKNGTTISGATGSSYSIASVAAADASTYTVQVSGACGSPVTSSNAVLNVNTNVGITTQPTATTTLCPGGAYTISVSPSGTSPYSYTWKKNGTTISGATNSSYSIASVAAADAAAYTVQVSGACGSPVTSSNAVLNVNAPIAITTQPTSPAAVCPTPASDVTFSVATSGTGPILQWQVSNNGGSSWLNCADGATYSGSQTATLSVLKANITSAMNGNLYRCSVTGTCSAAPVISSNGTLSVNSNVGIGTQPTATTTLCPGSAYTISVSPSGTSPYAYTWYKNGAAISGATNSSYSIASVTAADAATYTVQVSGACGSPVTSSNAVLNVNTNIGITTQPVASTTLCLGGTLNLSVVASGTSPGYQWKKNGTAISGATSSTYSIASVSAADAATYTVQVSGACGSPVPSNNAVVAINSNAPNVTTQPVNSTICSGANTTFSVVGSSPNGATLTHQWYVNPNTGTFTALGNTSVYSGVTGATLTLTAPPNTYANYQYLDVVKDGCSGLTVSSNAVTLTFYTAIPVTTNPSAQTVCPNAAAAFSIVASANSGSLVYQWQRNTGSGFSNLTIASPFSLSGGGSTLNISAAALAMNNDSYRVILTDGCGVSTQYTSPGVTLTVNNTVSITTDLTPSSNVCLNAALVLNVAASGTGLSYQWKENQGSGWNPITNVGVYSGATTNKLTISSVSAIYNNYQYHLDITGSCSSASSVTTTITVIQPPVISTNPVSVIACAQTAASLTGVATGTSPSYQWQYSSTGNSGTYTDIVGATSSTLSFASLSAANAGYYQLKASNGCGFSISSVAQVTVNPITSITAQPIDASVCPTFSKTFSVISGGTGPFTYEWWFDNNTSTWAKITGATSSSYTITNASTGNAGNYRVVVTGACGVPVTSSSAKLTVLSVPAQPVVSDVSRCGDGSISTTATSPTPTPSFNWYGNAGDVTPVFTGPTYNIANLTANATYWVTTVSQTCESSQKQVNFTRISPASVGLGVSPLSLCAGQGLYDLSKDITSTLAAPGLYSWSKNGTNYSGNNFDPAAVGSGSVDVTFTPSTTDKGTPGCLINTIRTVNVITNAGTGGISFNNGPLGSIVSGGNTINSCVGNDPIDLTSLVNINGGSWGTVTGSGISSSGTKTYFTPTTSNYTPTNPNAFSYTVNVNGCSATNTLYIYVKDNPNPPSITGVPAAACPGTALSLKATVSAVGTYSYKWFKAGATKAFDSLSNPLSYSVVGDETLYVRSVSASFGCASSATPVNIVTPFQQGTIQVDKNVIDLNDKVHFTYNGGTSGNSFGWNFGDGFASTELNAVHYYYSPGTYNIQLTITSTLGCSTTVGFSSITVNGTPIDIITGIEPNSGSELKGISMYPVPFTGVITVKSEVSVDQVRLLDMTGRVVHIQNPNLQEFEVRAVGLTPGIYFMTVQSGTKFSTVKVVKQ